MKFTHHLFGRIITLGTLLALWTCRQGDAATLIASFNAGSSPLTQGWSSVPGTGSAVVTSTVTVDSQVAWNLYEDHQASGTKNLYYSKALNTPSGNPIDAQLFAQGWEMNITLKVPDLSEGVGAWAQDRGITVGLARSIPNNREFYTLVFGRDANGVGKVTMLGTSGEMLLPDGFNSFSVRYTPGEPQASVYVNGTYWTAMNPHLLGSTGTSSILWGDNSISVNTSLRSAYYSHVSLYLIPEPSKALLLSTGLALLCLRRRR